MIFRREYLRKYKWYTKILGWGKSFAIFWHMLVYDMYITWLKQFKLWKVPTVVGSIVVVGVLTHCALLHSMCDLKFTQMNMQHSLIWELMLYKYKLSHNTMEATKNICCAKGEEVVDHSTVTRWWNKFCSGCKNCNDQAG